MTRLTFHCTTHDYYNSLAPKERIKPKNCKFSPTHTPASEHIHIKANIIHIESLYSFFIFPRLFHVVITLSVCCVLVSIGIAITFSSLK